MDRQDAILSIDEMIFGLVREYRPEPGGPVFPALLYSLDYTRVLTSPKNAGNRSSKPGSRPPADINWPSDAAEIRSSAIRWDATLRGSMLTRSSRVAFGAIPQNASLAEDHVLKLLLTDVRRWHRGAAVLLGYIDPDLDCAKLYKRPCFDCGKQEVYGIASTGIAACRGCGSEYSGARVRMLVRQGAA